jgi:hypothetical protein
MKPMIKFIKFAVELETMGTPDTMVQPCTHHARINYTLLQMASHYLLTYVAQEGLGVR